MYRVVLLTSFLFTVFLFTVSPLKAQEDYPSKFEFHWKLDAPLLAGGTGLYVLGQVLKNKVEPLTKEQLAQLDPNDINTFDRGATRQLGPISSNISDYLLTGSIGATFTLLGSRSVRHDILPFAVMMVEVETMNEGLTNITKGFFQRTRPFAYNPDVPESKKLKQNARHSFISGHVSNTAAFTFFTASLVNRYADRDWVRYSTWGVAIAVPATVGYLRYSSGNHFPTDIIAGYLVGAGSGLLVPFLHRSQLPEDISWRLIPAPGSITLIYNPK